MFAVYTVNCFVSREHSSVLVCFPDRSRLSLACYGSFRWFVRGESRRKISMLMMMMKNCDLKCKDRILVIVRFI
jgi:hypothetical protein